MTAPSTIETPELRGDICPPWCSGEHQVLRTDRGRSVHPDDAGVTHNGPVVDAWRPVYGEDGKLDENTIEVRIEGTRHDLADDWPDKVTATNVCLGSLGEVELHGPDARRLGLALIAAADLLEGRA